MKLNFEFVILIAVLVALFIECKTTIIEKIEQYTSLINFRIQKQKIFKTLDSLFHKHNIDYSVTGRTLVGILENNEFYNDNSYEAIVVKDDQIKNILYLSQEFAKHGYSIQDRLDGTFFVTTVFKPPHTSIHIIPLTLINDKWRSLARSGYSYNEWYYDSNLFPTRIQKLKSNMTVNLPHKSN